MKVNEGLRFAGEARTRPKERRAVHSNSFQQQMLDQSNRLNGERLRQLLDEVERRGEELLKQQTIERLRAYKASVKQFAQEAVTHGVGLRETRGISFRGEERRLKILRQLDLELLALTDELLRQEESTLELLGRIGEIKGLLLNLTS